MDQSCWDICTVLGRRLTYLSVARIITMQGPIHDVRIIIMMEQSNVNVSNSHTNNLHVEEFIYTLTVCQYGLASYKI